MKIWEWLKGLAKPKETITEDIHLPAEINGIRVTSMSSDDFVEMYCDEIAAKEASQKRRGNPYGD